TTSALVNCCPAATGCATARTGCLSSARSATVTNTSTTTATPSRASTNRPGERRGRSPTASAEGAAAVTRPLYRGGSSICTGELILVPPSPAGYGLRLGDGQRHLGGGLQVRHHTGLAATRPRDVPGD